MLILHIQLELLISRDNRDREKRREREKGEKLKESRAAHSARAPQRGGIATFDYYI
jgi:hypothetical protein